MALVTNMEKFEQIKKKMEESQKKKGGWANDDRQIDFQPGNKYKFRLLFYKNENTEFDGPFVEKWTHAARNSDDKYRIITCPTTQYAKSGFDKCPICTINNKLYNSGVDSDYELYKKFRRKFNGYALVYVIQDPVNEDNQGHVKIMRFGIDIHRELRSRIFGLENSNSDEPFDEDLYVGWDAFDLEKGNDLIITVTKKGEWNNYRVDFSPKKTAIKCDPEVLEQEIKDLKFGEDIREETEEKMLEFFNECVLEHVDVEDDNEVSNVMDEASESESSADVPSAEELLKEITGEAEAEAEAEDSKKEEKQESNDVAMAENDVDALLSQIEQEVKK